MPTTASSERVRFKHVLPIALPPPLLSGGAGNVLPPPTRSKHVLPPAGGVGEEKEGEEKEKEGEEKDAVSNNRGFYKRGGSGKGGLPGKFNPKPKASPPRLPGKIPLRIPIPAPPVKIPTLPKAPKIPTLPKPKSNPVPPKYAPPPPPPFHPNPPPPPFHPNPPPPTNHVPFGHHNSPPPHNSQCTHPRGIDRLRCYEPDAIIGTLLVIVALLALPFVVWRGRRMFSRGRRGRGRGQGGGDEERGRRGESLEMGRRGEGGKEGDVELGRIEGGEGERGRDGLVGMGMGREVGGDGRREVEVGGERCCVGRRGAGMESEDGGTVGMVGCEEGGEGVDCGNGEAFGRVISRERGGEWEGCEGGETEMENGVSEDELDREPSRGRRRDRGRSLPEGQLGEDGEQLGFGMKRENSVLSEGMVRTALVGLKVVGGEGVGVLDLGGGEGGETSL